MKDANGPYQFNIVFDSTTSKSVNRYILIQFLKPKLFLYSLYGSLKNRDFFWLALVPLLLLAVGVILQQYLDMQQAQFIVGGSFIWMMYSLIQISSMGKVNAIGCYHDNDYGKPPTLVAGIRFRFSQRQNTLFLSGVYVDSFYRGNGIMRILLLAVLKTVETIPSKSPIRIKALVPTHPASKKIAGEIFDGKGLLKVSNDLKSPFYQAIDKLDAWERKLQETNIHFQFKLKPWMEIINK